MPHPRRAAPPARPRLFLPPAPAPSCPIPQSPSPASSPATVRAAGPSASRPRPPAVAPITCPLPSHRSLSSRSHQLSHTLPSLPLSPPDRRPPLPRRPPGLMDSNLLPPASGRPLCSRTWGTCSRAFATPSETTRWRYRRALASKRGGAGEAAEATPAAGHGGEGEGEGGGGFVWGVGGPGVRPCKVWGRRCRSLPQLTPLPTPLPWVRGGPVLQGSPRPCPSARRISRRYAGGGGSSLGTEPDFRRPFCLRVAPGCVRLGPALARTAAPGRASRGVRIGAERGGGGGGAPGWVEGGCLSRFYPPLPPGWPHCAARRRQVLRVKNRFSESFDSAVTAGARPAGRRAARYDLSRLAAACRCEPATLQP